ncbi:Septin-type guanine nucleotide-binding (G) domain-containing protein [Mycena pura]|uniref:Septin-type guanine nucleotide-binding (G) domain-containing protein n=1 Tax=Mycena pura TaxID=153505 RepID=A0AAD6YL15_9AGAR|nr:Septin-type guanine nucleotide-binding (G) domain-containing protein [Mycena pura]
MAVPAPSSMALVSPTCPAKTTTNQLDKLTEVEIIKAELEEKQFKVKLTVIDTPGFGDYSDSWSPIVKFIDDQHEGARNSSRNVARRPTCACMRACFFVCAVLAFLIVRIIISLKSLDIEIMKHLGTRIHFIPVVAKADTLTQNGLFTFKQRIREVIAAQGIRIYTPPIEADDESAELACTLTDAISFSIIGSTEDVKTPNGHVVKGRG